ncbi:hypothetical protein BUALT_Bualt02G0128100 [Buddleja alternifolia]|uniref:F-box domain-containing protein n=1 Tax=Buddleja alternifolia TaxID=168488 RepID=A0AAV6Y3Y8_9LAMI|nr:hypothetical protein BUALT_Bualt02G0128100 [Buddleja alternifolia]
MENEIDNLLSIKRLEEPTVPEEIIIEILLRLPVKSLLKFKCVSKSWFVLISSYEFAKSHLKLSTKNDIYAHDRLVFVLGSKLLPMDIYTCSLQSVFECSASNGYVCPVTDANLPVHRVSFDYPYEANDWIWLEGSCNGLVCVSLSVSTLILWNPATRKLKALPDSGIDLSSDYYGLTYGFGFDELHDDYKVVEFFRFDRHMSEIEIQVKVYSLRTNSWKILSNWPGGDTFGGSAKFSTEPFIGYCPKIITEMLIGSFVKSLLCLRSVLKGWLSLISSSHFVTVHFKISTKTNASIHDR